MNNILNIYDNLIIIFYFLFVLGIGLYYSKGSSHSAENYFLAGRKMGWMAIGFSIFSTNISSEHLVGLATAGAKNGIVVGHFEWLAIIFILILGWLFAPVILKNKINTLPELIGRKFGLSVRKIYSGVSIVTYVFTKIAISLLAGGILLNEIFGWDFPTSITIMLLFTGIYTIVGGLRSVMYTQIFQSVVLILGGVLVAVFGIQAVGGMNSFFTKIPSNHLELFKGLSDPDFPWLGIVLGAPILAGWYWWADQYIVQRILSAENVTQAKKGTIFAAVLKIFPFLFLIIPGLIFLELNAGTKNSGVYSLLFKANIFPSGIKGIIISGFLAAIMSSLASAFNSIAALITFDFISHQNKSEETLILVGKLSTILIVLTSIAFIPLLSLFDNQIYLNLQRLQAYISPPILIVFLMSFFWKRRSTAAAKLTLILGELIAILRIVSDYLVAYGSVSNSAITFYHGINYLYFAVISFVFSGLVFILVTNFTKEEIHDYPPQEVWLKSEKLDEIIN